MCGSEGPEDAFATEFSLDAAILSNILRIIKVNEVMVSHLPIDRNGNEAQKQNDE
jgi:hypothetical protein